MPFFAFTKGLGDNQNTGNSQSMQSLARTMQFQERLNQQGRLVALREEQGARDAESFTVEQTLQNLRADKLEMNNNFDAHTLRIADSERQSGKQMQMGRFDRMGAGGMSPAMEDHAVNIKRLASQFPDSAEMIYRQGAEEMAEIQAMERNMEQLQYAETAIRGLNPPPAEGEMPNEMADKLQKGLADMLKVAQESGDPDFTERVLDSIFEAQMTLAGEDDLEELHGVSMLYMQNRLDTILTTRMESSGDGTVPSEVWERWEAANSIKNRNKRRGFKDSRVAMDEFDAILNARSGSDLRPDPVKVPERFTPEGRAAAEKQARLEQTADPQWRAAVIDTIDPDKKEAFLATLQSGNFASYEQAAELVGLSPVQGIALVTELSSTGQADAAVEARGALLGEKDAARARRRAAADRDEQNARRMAGQF